MTGEDRIEVRSTPWSLKMLGRMLRQVDPGVRFARHRVDLTEYSHAPIVVTVHDRESITVLLSEHFLYAPGEVVREVFLHACMRCSGEDVPRLGPVAVAYFTSDEYCLMCRNPNSKYAPRPMHRGTVRPGKIPPNIARVDGFAEAVAYLGEDSSGIYDLDMVWFGPGSSPRFRRPYAVNRYARLIWFDPVLADPRVPPAVVTYVVLAALAEYLSWSIEDCRSDPKVKAGILDRFPEKDLVETMMSSAGWVL